MGYLFLYRVLTLTLISNHLNKNAPNRMKATTKTAFFFMAMIALATSCSTKKTETTETTTMMSDTTMMMDSSMATDSSSMMSADSAQ